jgi:hypothetical protein
MKASTPIVTANRYSSPTNAIKYNVFKIPDGYSIQAWMPAQTAEADRSKVVKWLWSYRDQVRREFPDISVRFYNLDHGYGLEIKPLLSCHPIEDDGNHLKKALDESFKNVR